MLSEEQKLKFSTEGYLVVPDVVPDTLCDAVIQSIVDYAGIDLGDSATWYYRDFDGHGIIPLHHDQSLWDIRQHPQLHAAFADIYGTEDLFVSNDRVSFKPPAAAHTENWQRERVHWDADPWSFTGFQVQGLVYLTDTAENQGAFSCVPNIYQTLDSYVQAHEHDVERRYPQVDDSAIKRVPGKKGSLVIFNRMMPHTSDLNHANEPRFVQYVTMGPATEALREQTILEWHERRLPDWALTQAISNGKTHEPGPPPKLTPLGRKLVGLDRW